MKRKVLIIKGKAHNDGQKQSFEQIGNVYAAYFDSISGGAFDPQEIEIMTEPSVADIQGLLKAGQVDYAVLVLIGHGATQNGKQLFHLRDGEVINPGQMELSSSKQLVFVESCRSLRTGVPVIDINDKVPNFKLGGVFRYLISRERAKQLYLESLASCNDGIVVCFACDEDESAGKFRFSKTLLEKAKAWSNSSQNTMATLPISGLMPSVAAIVGDLAMADRKRQNPQLQGGISFPFVVSKY